MNQKTVGLVLKSQSYSEADKIFTVFTKEYGRISVMAKGVRKISSKRAGSLDSLNNLSLSLHQGSSDLRYVSEVKVIDSYSGIKNNMSILPFGYHILEILYKNTEEDSNAPKIYDLATSILKLLSKSSDVYINPVFLVNLFEVKFLNLSGYEVQLDACCMCLRRMESEECSFNVDKGGVVCKTCALGGLHVSVGVLKVFESLSKHTYNKNLLLKDIQMADELIKSYFTNVLGVNVSALSKLGV